MILGILIFIELIVLFLLSSRITQTYFKLFFMIFRHQQTTHLLLTLLYLPGTVVHELAHLLIAEILRVPTGEITFTPQIEKQGNQTEIRLGGLKVGKTDVVRRFLIGIAPVIVGIIFLVICILIFQKFWPDMRELYQQVLFISLIGYLIFTISNSMFSSRQDLEGVEYMIPAILLITAGLYVAGVRVNLTPELSLRLIQIVFGLAKALGIVVNINTLVLLANIALLKLFHRE